MKDIDSLLLVPPLNIVTLYQDPITREWAIQLCERAMRQCEPGGIQSAYWKLGLLSDPALFQQASCSAREANLIVVAAYARTDLPREVKLWIEVCLKEAQLHRGALVALLGKRPFTRDRSPATDYLTETAERAQVDYFLREFTLHTELSDLNFESIEQRANTTTPLLREILQRSAQPSSNAAGWHGVTSA